MPKRESHITCQALCKDLGREHILLEYTGHHDGAGQFFFKMKGREIAFSSNSPINVKCDACGGHMTVSLEEEVQAGQKTA